jgi:hypothetical protein
MITEFYKLKMNSKNSKPTPTKGPATSNHSSGQKPSPMPKLKLPKTVWNEDVLLARMNVNSAEDKLREISDQMDGLLEYGDEEGKMDMESQREYNELEK